MAARARRTALAKGDETTYEQVNTLAQWHITAVRKRKNGEITQVKHAAYGWMPVGEYYALVEFHKYLPLIGQLIQAGYQMKGYIWNSGVEISADFLASGGSITIPFGLILVQVAVLLYAYDVLVTKNSLYQVLDALAIFLPFGELYLIWRGGSLIWQIIQGFSSSGFDIGGVKIDWISLVSSWGLGFDVLEILTQGAGQGGQTAAQTVQTILETHK